MVLDWQRTIVVLAVLAAVVALALSDVLGSEAVVAVLGAITGWLVPAPKLAGKVPA